MALRSTMQAASRLSPRNAFSRPAVGATNTSSRATSLISEVAQWQAMRIGRFVGPCYSTAPGTTSTVATQDAPPAPASAAPAAAAPAAAPAEPDVSQCDIRVGRIVSVELHPDADSLYVEQIDVGEPEPRTIVSGLVKFVPMEQMQNRNVIVICNLKPRKMRGIASNGMVLCASNDAHDQVEPLTPPEGAKPGERVWFGEGNEKQGAPAEPNRVQKKKIWEGVQPLLKTDTSAVAGFKGRTMLTSAGPVKAASLTNANIA